MNDLLRHRGPDDEGTWVSPDRRLIFGHRRLSIIDLSAAGRQPMTGPDGTTVVFNGEIYNYESLRNECPDWDFETQTDTEVILSLYAAYGESCLQYMNGMFALAIWDPGRESLFCRHDR